MHESGIKDMQKTASKSVLGEIGVLRWVMYIIPVAPEATTLSLDLQEG